MFWPKIIEFSFWPLGCVILDQICLTLSRKWKIWSKMKFELNLMLKSIAIVIFLNYVLYSKSIINFLGNIGQIWSKIKQPSSQIQNLTFLGWNILSYGKHDKNLEFQCSSSKKWFLVLDSRKKLVFEFFLIRSRRRGFQFMNF